MKKIIFFLLFPSILFAVEIPGEQTYSQRTFGGLVDEYSADDIPANNSPDLLNIYLDEYTGAITKRKGSIKDNSTVFTGNQWIRNLYDYKKINGDEYIVANSSASVLVSAGDSNYTAILTGQDIVQQFDFTTAKDYLYGCNGTTIFKSTGTTATLLTVANSTGIPTTAKYMKYINNRMFFAGMSATPSQVWYSEINDPDNVQSLNYILINVSDGDYITGIFAYMGKIIVTKRYSTWELIEVSVGVFQIRPISQKIGCLYQTTMQEYQNYPVWLSERGLELYDGQFNLISKPIDNLVKSLNQLYTNQSIWTQDTAADWGAGSGTNIDTTTYSGSVAQLVDNTLYTSSNTADVEVPYGPSAYWARIKYIPSSDIYITTMVWCRLRSSSGQQYIYNYHNYFYDANWNLIATADNPTPLTINMTLMKNATYWLKSEPYTTIGGGGGQTTFVIERSSQTMFMLLNCATTYIETSPNGTTWTSIDNSWLHIHASYKNLGSASYISQSKNATSWGSWGTFNADETKPTGSSIDYYAVTSTSSYNLGTNTPFALTNGGAINSTVGPYIKVISSFTRTDPTVTPMLDKFKISYYGVSNMIPASIIYKDRYYLSVSTDTNNMVNDTVLIYDKNGQWLKHSGNWGSACIYRGSLYSGDSTKGQVYKQDINGVYTDDNTAYDSYYTTKKFDFREQDSANSLRDKIYEELWTCTNIEAAGNLNISYRLDGTDGNWTSLYNVPLTEKYINKLNFSAYPKSQFIQVKFGNNDTNKFTLKAFYLPFLIEPRK